MVVLLDALAHHKPVDLAASVGVVGIGLIEHDDKNSVAGGWVQVSAVE